MFSAPQVWDELKPVKCQNPAEAPCGNSGLFWWANLSYDIGELKLVHQWVGNATEICTCWWKGSRLWQLVIYCSKGSSLKSHCLVFCMVGFPLFHSCWLLLVWSQIWTCPSIYFWKSSKSWEILSSYEDDVILMHWQISLPMTIFLHQWGFNVGCIIGYNLKGSCITGFS